jgi:tetratricopeptide (TPR) repeat protein
VKLLPLVLAVATSGLLALPPEWRHNPRERTRAALQAWRAGDYEAADAALAEALAIAPDQPLLQFNAGTGRLAAGQLAEALRLLEEAAASGDDSLVPDALYNVGNTLLDGGNPSGAVEAYKRALRSDPGHAAAKHNLELALREQQQESPSDEGQQQQEEGEGKGEEGSGSPGPEDGDGPGDHPGEAPGAGGPDSGERPPQQGPEPPDSPALPDFQDQEDMSAEQATALLEAVEALEREQRRARAEEQRRLRAARLGVEKDW